MTDRLAGRIPNRVSHIAAIGDAKLFCGKTVNWGKRVHKSARLCKTCERVWRKRGGNLCTYFDEDGWSIPMSNFTATSGTTATTATFFFKTWKEVA